MTEARVQIHELRLRLRGIDEPTARLVVAGLSAAIASGLDVGRIVHGGSRTINSINLGALRMPAGATPGAVRGRVAAAVSTGLSSPPLPAVPTGGPT